jgi:probable rRNA maturation factor
MLLVDDELMAQLNERFRGVQGPTDVLSFPQGSTGFEEVRPTLLGDVVVSTESAQRQADEMGLSLEEEMDLLLTHGILHLLGYDHEASLSDAVKMKVKEAEVLNALKGG